MRSKFCDIHFLLIICIFTFVGGPRPVSGQSPPTPLTLSEAIHTALTNNPGVKAAQYDVEASESQIRQAESGYFPQIYFSEAFNRTTNPMWTFGTKLNQSAITLQDFNPVKLNNPDAISNFATDFYVDWSIYEGGKTRLSVNQARETHEGMALNLQRTRQNIVAKTATAYIGLLLAHKNVSVVRQALETAQAHLKMVRSRYESGFVVKSDLLRAQVRIAELDQKLLQAESRVEVAQAHLNAIMGMSDEATPKLITPFEEGEPLKGSLEDWIQTAMTNRPDFRHLVLQESIARDEIAKSKAGHFPSLNLVGNYQINSENFSETADNYTLGAVLKLNLYSGHRISAKTVEARAFLQKIKSVQKNMELGIRVQTKQAFLLAQSEWKQIQVTQTTVEHAQEGLRIVSNRYKNGLLTIVSLMDADVSHHQAQTRHFQSLHDYRVAKINLELAAGTIDSDFQ
ncbi:TolC family protein [Thermodesulfobacteriota bacterium]